MLSMSGGHVTSPYPLLPAGFTFGTSTAAYQIEGAAAEDGKGPSIWDTFTAEPGRIQAGSTGAVACDHYHRYPEDVALTRGLGADGYRFSISWPRVQPSGRGPVNADGLAFYDRLVDALLAAGIQPMATLYHWDLPEALQQAQRGGLSGWQLRDTAERFGEYAAVVAERRVDRVAHWVPVNEPNVVTFLGHALGLHAPGKELLFDSLPVAHHLNLGHGLAVHALRSAGATSIGTANNHAPMWPASESEADRDAAGLFDTLWNGLFADPMLLGRYPEGFGDAMPGPVVDDLAIIAQPLDFYGMNYYNPMSIAAAAGALPFEQRELTGYPTTDFGWPIVPEGLTEMLTLLRERYPELAPVFVTENGCSCAAMDDQLRIDYLDAHLHAVSNAIQGGVDVRGYYCWSLVDNFEWAEGYTQRFGLVHVDFDTQVRTPRASFRWYADTIRANR
jgi:beta-glucosidase